jgi:type IV pilus assembly protein PilN
MIRINLLPHRAERRKRRQVQFISLSILTLLLGVLVVGFVHGIIGARISYQERRNDFLKNEIAKLDKQIEEIRKLRQQVRALLARKEVVENLQSTRSDVVHLLDQMLRILPNGVYLKSLKQTNNKIEITGLAQSNARISTLMRAIDSSPWLDSPTLVEIHAATGSAHLNEFTLFFNLTKKVTTSSASSSSVKKG